MLCIQKICQPVLYCYKHCFKKMRYEFKYNTSLAAKGALTHRLQRRSACNTTTACLIQNGRQGLEISQILCYWTP